MRRFLLFLAFSSALLLPACSSRMDLTRASDQMDFGVRMARANLWREALFRFERATQIDPNDAQALNNLAVAYEGIGEFEKARETYTRALALDKSNQHIQKNYSRFVEFYSRNRKRETALEKAAEAKEAEEPEAPATPVQLSQPEEPPRPGEIPVSDLPPDPKPPVPAPPATTPPPGGGL